MCSAPFGVRHPELCSPASTAAEGEVGRGCAHFKQVCGSLGRLGRGGFLIEGAFSNQGGYPSVRLLHTCVGGRSSDADKAHVDLSDDEFSDEFSDADVGPEDLPGYVAPAVPVAPAVSGYVAPAVPEAVEAASIGGAGSSGGGDHTRRIEVPGGYLLWSSKHRTLDAHCLCGHATQKQGMCKADRTLKPSTGGRQNCGQGRPLGRHLLWLSIGTAYDRADHLDAKKNVGGPSFHVQRAHCRALFELRAQEDATIAEFLSSIDGERPARDGETSEPIRSP
jgi:hypothetical protein